MKPRTIQEFINEFNPCSDARRWLKKQSSLADAWEACRRPDWMLWILQRMGPRKRWVQASFAARGWTSTFSNTRAARDLADNIRAVVENPWRPKRGSKKATT